MAVNLDDVMDELLDNADFEASGSLSKAKAFVTAAVRYFILVPEESQDHEGNRQRMGHQLIHNLLADARAFVAANDTSRSQVRFLGPGSDFR